MIMPADIPFSAATLVALPRQSGIADRFALVHFADAYAIRLPSNVLRSPDALARFIFMHQPPWIRGLMLARDAVARCCGLKTSSRLADGEEAAGRVGIFRTCSTTETDIVLGADDRHLDFRIAVSLTDGTHACASPYLTVATVVHCHNLLGRSYIAAIAPFHRLIVKSCLRRAAERGWPRAGHAAEAARAPFSTRQQ